MNFLGFIKTTAQQSNFLIRNRIILNENSFRNQREKTQISILSELIT